MPLWVPLTITQKFRLPLPAARLSDEAQVTCTDTFAAHVPLRLQLVSQAPALHVAAPASEVHTFPHVPQLVVVVVGVSHPLAGSPSQSP